VVEQAPSRINSVAAIRYILLTEVMPADSARGALESRSKCPIRIDVARRHTLRNQQRMATNSLQVLLRHVRPHLDKIIDALQLRQPNCRADFRQPILPSKLIVALEVGILKHFFRNTNAAFAGADCPEPQAAILSNPHG